MFSVNRFSYLHNAFSDVNPRVLNRCVDRALAFSTKVYDLEPPFNRLSSEQPNIPVRNLDIIHRPIGYGRWAMPKLRHDLSNKDECVVISSLETITELVMDPERAFEALNLRLIDRMVNLLVAENPAIRERSALALFKMSRITKAREVIVGNKEILRNLSIGIEDPYEEVRLHIAKLLQILAEFWKCADQLIAFGFIPILLHILQDKEERFIVLIHLGTLKFLMYSLQGKMNALDNNGMNVLLGFIRDENSEILSEALSCVALLTSTCEGEKIARETNLLYILEKLLQDERPEIHTNAACVIMYCTVKATGKIMAAEYPRIIPRLLHLAKNRLNPSTQMFAIKALANISENPALRKLIMTEYSHEIELIQVGEDENIKMWKQQLIDVISWTP